MTTPYGMEREPRLTALRYWLAERRVAVIGWLLVLLVVMGGLGLWQAGAVNPSPLAQPPTSFGVPGANLFEKGATGPEVEVGAVGEGEARTYIIRAKGARGPQPAVIFLHGFGSSFIAGYEPWISHLARQGLTVIFPSWQAPPYPTDGSQNPRAAMFQGVKLAVDAVPVQRDKVAVLGFSAGGALAFDYAALSSKLDVPKAKLVYSIYPGRAFPGQKDPILPLPPIGAIPADTRIVTLVSRKDEDAGTFWGRQQYAALAPRPDELRALVYITEPGLGDHYAPGDTTVKARRVFWRPFDKELSQHVGIVLTPDRQVIAATRAEQQVIDQIERESLFRKRVYDGKQAERPADPDAQPGARP
jgi:dienelactone hydrolase